MKKRHDMISEVMLVQNLDSMILKAWKGEISELRQRSRMAASPVDGRYMEDLEVEWNQWATGQR